MRAACLLIFALVLGASSASHAALPKAWGTRVASPSTKPLPLRGSIFVASRGEHVGVRWLTGSGEANQKWVGDYARVDYVANEFSVLEIVGIEYTLTADARATRPHAASLRRFREKCTQINITLDADVAVVKARLTRGDHVEDYWLVTSAHPFRLHPTCDPADVPVAEGTLEVFATLADGREVSHGGPVSVAQIPFFGEDVELDLDIDPRVSLAFAMFVLVVIACAFTRPRVALHGLTVTGHLPPLRIRVRLPRARIHHR